MHEERFRNKFKAFVVFQVKLLVKTFSIYHEKIRWYIERTLKSFVDIKLEITSFEVLGNRQYSEFNFYITFQRNKYWIFLLQVSFWKIPHSKIISKLFSIISYKFRKLYNPLFGDRFKNRFLWNFFLVSNYKKTPIFF